VQRALAAVEGYFFILPVDMPLLTGEHLREVYERRDPEKVVSPGFGGMPGHPVLCPPVWKEKLLSGRGKSPSSMIKKEDQILIPWEDDSVVLDVDTQDAYDAYLGRQL
jgi:CTP:molybdopterin cytidylyltransferase MocA